MAVDAATRVIGNKAGNERAARLAGGNERGLRQSMRGFLDLARRTHPDEVVAIATPVSQRFDMTATVFELQDSGRYPVLIFENVEGFDMPVVTNIAANR